MRERLTQAMKDAMRAKDQTRLTTIRLVLSAIKDHDLGIKPVGGKTGEPAGDAEITQIMARMIKQRRDSIEAYEKAARPELAQKEKDEITLIEEFLPKQLGEAETRAAVAAAIKEAGAASVKDMGKAMAVLKQRYAGQLDFGKASALVKEMLG
ncbi:MAG: GatB/YqeY domain-containing protein [Hyphomicrobiaceae bacterium]